MAIGLGTTVGAIVVRSLMTLGVVWLLKVPGLMLVGGLGLLWIAYKLLADQGEIDLDFSLRTPVPLPPDRVGLRGGRLSR